MLSYDMNQWPQKHSLLLYTVFSVHGKLATAFINDKSISKHNYISS